MRAHSRAGVVAAAAAIVALGCDGTGEYGENDTRSNAYEVELDRRYESEIRRSGSVEWFEFTTAHGEETFDEVEIDVRALDQGIAPSVRIYDTDGRDVSAETAPGLGEDFAHVFVTRGDTFYLRFSGWDPDADEDHGSSGAYAFRVRNLHANDEFAGNHSREDAHELELGVAHDGVLVSTLEADYYWFETAHADNTYDEVQILLSVRSSELTARLEVHDSMGGEVHVDTSEIAGAGLAHAFITTGGSFYVRVSGWDPDSDRDHGSAGSYRLTVANSFANDEFGGNHSIADAYEVELGTTYQGALLASEEADYFRFTTGHTESEYDTVVVEVTVRDAGLRANIDLYDHRGVRSNLSARAGAPGENVSLGWVSPGGVRYIRISGLDGSTGNYSFRIRNLWNNDPYMGNHTYEDAHPIDLDTDYAAVLLCIYETDWFRVENAKAGQSYSVIVTPTVASLTPHVQVFSASRMQINRSTATSPGGEVVATFDSRDDAFVIRISGWHLGANVDNGSRGPYRFRVVKNE